MHTHRVLGEGKWGWKCKQGTGNQSFAFSLGEMKMITLCLLLSLLFNSSCTRDSYEDLLKHTHVCISLWTN